MESNGTCTLGGRSIPGGRGSRGTWYLHASWSCDAVGHTRCHVLHGMGLGLAVQGSGLLMGAR